MFHLVDESIAKLLRAGIVAEIPRSELGDVHVSFDSPGSQAAGDDGPVTVVLYLMDVQENLSLRDDRFLTREHVLGTKVMKGRAAARIDLSYLVTVYGPSRSAEHRVLAAALKVLMRTPELPKEYVPEALERDLDFHPMLTVAQPSHPAHERLQSVWRALNAPLRPSLGLVVNVGLNPWKSDPVELVREAVLGVRANLKREGPSELHRVRVGAAGRVTDGDGKPIEGVRVGSERFDAESFTDKNGVFVLQDLLPGPQTLLLRKDGYEEREEDTVVPSPGRPDTLVPILAVLPRLDDREASSQLIDRAQAVLRAVAGRIEYEDGRPAASVEVRAGDVSTITNPDGTYVLLGVGPGCELIAILKGGEERVVTPLAMQEARTGIFA